MSREIDGLPPEPTVHSPHSEISDEPGTTGKSSSCMTTPSRAKTATSKPNAESHPRYQILRRNRGRASSQIRRLIPRRHPNLAIALRRWHQARRQGEHPPVQGRHSSNRREPRESPGSPRHTYVKASLFSTRVSICLLYTSPSPRD